MLQPAAEQNLSLGELLRSLRKKRKLTQSELGTSFASASMISQIENGKVVPTWSLLGRISERLGVEPEYFLQGCSGNSAVAVFLQFRMLMNTEQYRHAITLLEANQDAIATCIDADTLAAFLVSCYEHTGRLHLATLYGEKRIFSAVQEQDVISALHLYYELGSTCKRANRPGVARMYWRRGVKLYERSNFEETPPVAAKLYTALAHSARDAGDFEHATMFYEFGVKLNESLQFVFQLAILLLELARVHLDSGHYGGAVAAAEQAKFAFARVRSRRGENECNLVLGRAHRNLGQPEVSNNLLEEVVLQGSDSALQNTSLTDVYFELGLSFAAEKNFEQAERWLEKTHQSEEVTWSQRCRFVIAKAELLLQEGMMNEARCYAKEVMPLAFLDKGQFAIPDDTDLLLHLILLWNRLSRGTTESGCLSDLARAAAQKLRRLCERD